MARLESILKSVAADIATATGVEAEYEHECSVGGGCINQAMRIRYGDVTYFVKFNNADKLDMFAAEAAGLQELGRADGLHIPAPLCWGEDGLTAWLVMENLQLGGSPQPVALGEGLAAMHRIRHSQFGWHRDNTIGSTPQPNSPTDSWVDFWREQRLRFQLELASSNGAGNELASSGEKLLEQIPLLFTAYQPKASLLHGDLWSGNHAYTLAGRPTIFDPAVYFGDRETDLAMTELFGGFGNDFYTAYNNAWPLDAGYKIRKILYNLYHILNHFNLFGGGYASQAQRMIDSLLNELNC